MLSDEQLQSFWSLGYCVAHVPVQRESVERATTTVWELSPPSFDPSNPKSWTGLFKDCCKTQTIKDRFGRVKFRECLRREQWLYDLTAGNADIVAAVGDLIEDPLAPEYVRGLYPVFPTRPGTAAGHCDRHKFQVGVVLYLSHVVSRGGGFTVWPASHHIMAKHQATLGAMTGCLRSAPRWRRCRRLFNPSNCLVLRGRWCSGITDLSMRRGSTRGTRFGTPHYATSRIRNFSPQQIGLPRTCGRRGHLVWRSSLLRWPWCRIQRSQMQHI